MLLYCPERPLRVESWPDTRSWGTAPCSCEQRFGESPRQSKCPAAFALSAVETVAEVATAARQPSFKSSSCTQNKRATRPNSCTPTPNHCPNMPCLAHPCTYPFCSAPPPPPHTSCTTPPHRAQALPTMVREAGVLMFMYVGQTNTQQPHRNCQPVPSAPPRCTPSCPSATPTPLPTSLDHLLPSPKHLQSALPDHFEMVISWKCQ